VSWAKTGFEKIRDWTAALPDISVSQKTGQLELLRDHQNYLERFL